MYRASSALQLARSAALMRTPLYGVLGGLVRRALSTASRPPPATSALGTFAGPFRFRRQIKGRVSPPHAVPESIERPLYAATGAVPPTLPPVSVHDAAGAQRMRDACLVARDVLAFACEQVTPGMSTDELDRLVHEKCVVGLGVYPSPLNYSGFPKSVCTSVNEVVCHGIPDELAVLNAGDIVKLDVSCFVRGFHGDTCRTVIAGGSAATDAAGRRLVATTKSALDTAAALCGPGVRIRRIGATIEPLAAAAGFASVREYAGHGIGQFFHTLPLVFHHDDERCTEVMRPGMTFTIEPMLVERSPRVVLWPDGWTVVTADGGRAAQFEHTLLITEHGCDILTAYEGS